MDACLADVEEKGSGYFDSYVEMLESARKALKGLKHLELVETEFYDKSKLVISVKNSKVANVESIGFSSTELYDTLLQQYHLQMEMKAGSYVLAMTSVADSEEGMQRLVNALIEIDYGLMMRTKMEGVCFELPKLEQKYTVAQIESMRRKASKRQYREWDVNIDAESIIGRAWEKCVGCTSTEYAYVYPPGIPLIVPGEVISREVCRLLEMYKTLGFSIEGLKKEEEIEVLING